MTQEEEILIRLGIDNTSMRAGTNAALDMQKKASMEYVGFWETALAKKDKAEAAQLDASFARYEKNLARQKSADETYFATRKAQIEAQAEIANIANGSGAFGSLAKKGEGELARDVESGVAGAAAGAAIKHGASTSIFREIQVLIHEGLAQRWKQFISSFSRLLMFMGLTAETLVSSIPIIGAAVAAGIGMIHAAKGMEDNQATFSIEPLQKRLEKQIRDAQKAGKISPDQASAMLGDTRSVAGIRKVQTELSKIPGAFDDPEIAKQAAEKAKEVARENNQAWKAQLAAERESMGHQDRITSLIKEHRAISLEMSKLDRDGVEYAQKLVEQRELAKQVEQERKEMAKEQIDLQKEYNEDVKDVEKIQRSISQIGVSDALPSIEDLAGRAFTENLNSQYGAAKWERRGRRWVKVGGQFDLGAGDGPFAQAAQEAELAKKQEQWDIIHGNAQFQYNPLTGQNELAGGQALEDRSRRVAAENLLSQAGLETPEMKADKMNQDISAINVKIGQLLTQAQHDGIVIKTQN